MTLRAMLKKAMGIHDDALFLMEDDNAVQTAWAPLLRKIAIEELRQGNGVIAKSYRGEFTHVAPALEELKSSQNQYNTYLSAQAKNGAWLNYIELGALAERLGVNLVITPIKNGVQQTPYCPVKQPAELGEITYTVHLYCSNNKHWHVDKNPASTKGDGNCGVNAFAQSLTRLVRQQEKTNIAAVHDETKSTATLISNQEQLAVDDQKRILNTIKKQPSSTQLHQQCLEEKQRISKLSKSEQKQISDDHALAVKLASEPEKRSRLRAK